LLLDEATEGLAPRVRAEIWRVLATVKSAGQAILVVDKNIAPLLRLADRHYILDRGRTVWSGTSAALEADAELQHRYLGV
jgi:branched-chain amino acid transport system ATP-binding protein